MKLKTMKTKKRYTPEELAEGWKADLLNDATCAEEQAQNGPFYPERGITKETLLAYAAKCRQDAEKPIPSEFAFSKV